MPDAQALLVKTATTWPNQTVRLSALELVARRDGLEAARRLAQHDASARVRAWSETIVGLGGETARSPATDERAPDRPAARAKDDPPTLI